ncbi:hypothetical protein CLAFUW4_08767 [Fulvia fulva]|uniref:Uncharacterized protein n=1 Tax=Passalora fulva TaxID=5499 RepID=A0A9Q8PG72_PASFU|nr:uncharacterized protein CLAFUR5_08867 [Fulvia fulva]KAK4614235.1 hypothetical protein CLAFUR4_08772 [Fulvia fulva]KAK4614669.1 hypothetical protein CLAFUR0_08767 [Fulvia fulva]UJO21830.1 hypothetical protein CLAFUR5_08867 [Fulvia fulva]WPV20379.1 hypothetical protein CLAFUW4_08767 [Fulvia fulva]WPV34972.1 hypothetical protein CLAFUW7_08767 [Fulvia fulva]
MAAPSTPPENKTCHLLELPAELRNTIYRYTLCAEEEIAITSDSNNCHQPALLRTCRQVRQEAAPIYYHENEITIDAPDFDPSLIIAFWQHAGRHIPFDKRSKVLIDIGRNVRSWNNLLSWVKAFWDGRVTYMVPGDPGDYEWNAGAGAFAIAIKVKAMKGAWADVEDWLEIYKMATNIMIGWE